MRRGRARSPACTTTMSTCSPWRRPPARSTWRPAGRSDPGGPRGAPCPAPPSGPCTTTRWREGRWIAGGSTRSPRARRSGSSIARGRCGSSAGSRWRRSACRTAPGGRGDRTGRAAGRPTGRLFRLDAWLRERLAPVAPTDLAAVGRRLASFGVTGVTDCTPTAAVAYFDTLAEAVRTGALPLTV